MFHFIHRFSFILFNFILFWCWCFDFGVPFHFQWKTSFKTIINTVIPSNYQHQKSRKITKHVEKSRHKLSWMTIGHECHWIDEYLSFIHCTYIYIYWKAKAYKCQCTLTSGNVLKCLANSKRIKKNFLITRNEFNNEFSLGTDHCDDE